MNRRTLLTAVSGSAMAPLAGCSVLGDLGDDPCSGDDCDVGMTRNAFVPEEYEVGVGDTVVWRNTSGADHTVTAYESGIPEDADYFATGGYEDETAARNAWNDGDGGFSPGETFEHTFEVPGTYAYVCLPHEKGGMTGTIVVSE